MTVHDLPAAERLALLSTAGQDGTAGGRIYDAHIAEVARAAGAKVVITDNRRHFLAALRYGIRVETPSEFLAALKARRPASGSSSRGIAMRCTGSACYGPDLRERRAGVLEVPEPVGQRSTPSKVRYADRNNGETRMFRKAFCFGLIGLLLCHAPVWADTAGRPSATRTKSSSSTKRVVWTLVGIGAGFGAGVFIGLHAFDDAINSDRKVWMSAIAGAAAGGLAGGLLSRNVGRVPAVAAWGSSGPRVDQGIAPSIVRASLDVVG